MTTVILKSPRHLGAAVNKLGKDVERQIIRGLRKTARLGVREVIRTALTSQPRPHAHGTYLRSWRSIHIDGGAVVTNTADHALFVEIGRKPGRQPPTKAIIDWIVAKRLDKKLGRKLGRRRRTNASPSRQRALAFVIARKIGRKGFKGRYILRRAMPEIEAEAVRQIQEAIRRALGMQG